MAAKSKMAPKTEKILFLLPNGQFWTDFKHLFCVLFVLLVSINNGWVWEFSIQDGGGNSKKRIFLKKSTFTKPPIIWEILKISTNPKRRNVAQPLNIYQLFCFLKYSKMAEISKMAFGVNFHENRWISLENYFLLSWLLVSLVVFCCSTI